MQAISEEKLNEWRLLLAERERNGLTISEFCQQKNINPSRYYYYQALIKNPDKVKEKQQINKIKDKQSTEIKPVKIVSAFPQDQASIRLILPNSLQCILPRDIAINEMKAIVELLLSC